MATISEFMEYTKNLKKEYQKLEKAIEIIKKICEITLNEDSEFNGYSIEINGYMELSQEEFELLKEVINNE